MDHSNDERTFLRPEVIRNGGIDPNNLAAYEDPRGLPDPPEDRSFSEWFKAGMPEKSPLALLDPPVWKDGKAKPKQLFSAAAYQDLLRRAENQANHLRDTAIRLLEPTEEKKDQRKRKTRRSASSDNVVAPALTRCVRGVGKDVAGAVRDSYLRESVGRFEDAESIEAFGELSRWLSKFVHAIVKTGLWDESGKPVSDNIDIPRAVSVGLDEVRVALDRVRLTKTHASREARREYCESIGITTIDSLLDAFTTLEGGKGESTIRRWWNGAGKPSRRVLGKIARATLGAEGICNPSPEEISARIEKLQKNSH